MGKNKGCNKEWLNYEFYHNTFDFRNSPFSNMFRTDLLDITQVCQIIYGEFAVYISYFNNLKDDGTISFYTTCCDNTKDDTVNTSVSRSSFLNMDLPLYEGDNLLDTVCGSSDLSQHTITCISFLDDTKYSHLKKCLSNPWNSSFMLCDNLRVIMTRYGVIAYSYNPIEKMMDSMKIAAFTEKGLNILEDYVRDNLSLEIVKSNQYGLVYRHSGGGFSLKRMPIESPNVDVSKNYNKTLDYQRILNYSIGDKTSLVMLHGKPGTGKTYLIRKLINDIMDSGKDVLYIDPSIFESFSSASFFDFLLSHKDSTLIMEDCEAVLLNRDKAFNSTMNTLLNLTDGIVGDSLSLHFICTFNTNVNNIDKALLRKGRLSYMYEFEPLTLEKTREWIPDAKKSMTIADIFNYNVENNANVENRPIGFQN